MYAFIEGEVCEKVNGALTLLAGGVEIVENICNLGEIEADRCWPVGTFANTQGDSGVWVRILAYYK